MIEGDVGLFTTINVMLLAAFISCISAFGIVMNWRNSKNMREHSLEKNRIDIYLSLRREFQNTRKLIPNNFFYGGDYQLSSDQKNNIMRYWFNAFDEWFVTQKLNDGVYSTLWEEYFSPAIQSTLRSKTMVSVLVEMLEGPTSFGKGKKEEFRRALEKLNQELDIAERAEVSLYKKKT